MVKSLKDNKGFTLIELVMVIILVAILAAVAIPRFVDLSSDADDAAADGVLGGLRSGISIYYASTAAGGNASYPADPTDTALTGPMSSLPTINAVTTKVTNSTTCTADLSPGDWGQNNDDAPTRSQIVYRRRGNSDCMTWDYTSSTGTIGTLVTVAD
ncbi:MAG: type IV pilin protein [Thermodesulfobacteriota bacterium]